MTELKCEICGGGELLAGTGFCRQCGAAVSAADAIETSESPTAIFPPPDAATTQRLQARPTTREQTGTKPSASSQKIFLLVAVIVLLLGVIAAVAVLSDQRLDAVPKEALLYPGATTVVDLDHSDGGRTMHLQTPDPLNRVESWYQNSLDLDKTLRLTSNSVVMKNAKVAITLAVEDNKTNILIKQAP